MAEVTYYVALPFVAADDGVAAGEPTECFNPIAVVMRAWGGFQHRRGAGRVISRVQFSGQASIRLDTQCT
jgi:hypothetical protein